MSSSPIGSTLSNSAKFHLQQQIQVQKQQKSTLNITKGSMEQKTKSVAIRSHLQHKHKNQQQQLVVSPNQCINIFMIVRILLTYLEKVDTSLLLRVKAALKDFDKRKKNGDPEYQSMSHVISEKMPEITGQIHWTRAVEIHKNYLKNIKLKKKNMKLSSSSTYSQQPQRHQTYRYPNPTATSSSFSFTSNTTTYFTNMMDRISNLPSDTNTETDFQHHYPLPPSPAASTAITLISLGDMETKTDTDDGCAGHVDNDTHDDASYLNHLEAASTLSNLPRDQNNNSISSNNNNNNNNNNDTNNPLLSPCTLSSFADIQEPFTLQPHSIYHHHYQIKGEEMEEDYDQEEGNYNHMEVIMDTDQDQTNDLKKQSTMDLEQDQSSCTKICSLVPSYTIRDTTGQYIIATPTFSSQTFFPPTSSSSMKNNTNSESKSSSYTTTSTTICDSKNSFPAETTHTNTTTTPMPCIIRQTAETLLMVQKDNISDPK